MDSNYSAHQTPQFRVLSDQQITRLYQATLECLQTTGVKVNNAEARELLANAGARVEGTRVWIPPTIIQDAIAANPRAFSIWGRDQKYRMHIVPDRVYFGPGPTSTHFIDPHTGERRRARRGDPGMTARVCDALDHIDYVMSLALIDDVTPTLASVYECAEMIANTGKPVLAWGYHPDHIAEIYAIAIAAMGGEENFRARPCFGLFTSSHAPLMHTNEELGNMLWAAERDIPIIYLGAGTAGSTAPITGAGLLVVILAEALSGLAIVQLKKRGAPMCVGGVPMPMDLRTARPSYGAPELSLYSAALADVLRFLGLPMMGTAGATESKVVDLQAAMESTLQIMLSSLSGATLVHDIGFLDCADIGSLEMLVMNDEIIAMAKRVMRGIAINDDTLMLDLIDRVGPGGEFMSTVETAKRCRAEIWSPKLLDREQWINWESAGSTTTIDRIKTRVQKILAEHSPLALPDGAAEQIEKILRDAEAREKNRSL